MKKSDEQEQKYRKELMKGLPPINLGALFMPPIWGPANGIWITILYYPLWLFADNLFYASFTDPSPLSVVFSIIGYFYVKEKGKGRFAARFIPRVRGKWNQEENRRNP